MKTLFRICIVLVVVMVIALVAGYFLLTNAGFQKRLIESKLPEGSSIKSVQVTTDTLELSELVLVLADGTRVKVAAVDTTFKPLAALFDHTIRLGVLDVDGLRIDLPEAVAASMSSVGGKLPRQGAAPTESVVEPTAPKPRKATKPWESIYQVGNLDWLFDVEAVNLNGKLKDSMGTVYAFKISSGSIRPGAETVMNTSLKLVSNEPIQSGLKEFDSEAQLTFLQKSEGGFESFRLESRTSGKDLGGASVLTVSQVLEVSIKGFDEAADVSVQFNADLKRPEMFLPELASFGALTLEGQAIAKVEGEVMTVSSAALDVSSKGTRVLELNLKKALTLGGKQNLTGELLEVKMSSLPLSWFGPWLPEGMFLEGAPVSAQIAVSGDASGALELRALQPIHLGPLTIRDNESILMKDVSLLLDPLIRVNADQSIHYTFKTFQVMDRYGELVGGEATGSYQASEAKSSNPFDGLKAEAKLNMSLQELFRQPLLASNASVLGGSLALNLNIDGNHEYPLRAQGAIRSLQARSLPGQTRVYRFAAQLKNASTGVWALGANFEAGSVDRPTTSLQLSGQANPQTEPLAFTLNLVGPRLSQSDVSVLAAAFSPTETVAPPTKSAPVVRSPTSSSVSSRAPQAVVSAGSTPPMWAGLKGDASIKLDAVNLESGYTLTGVAAQAVVSESLLKLSGISARMGTGSLSGGGEVRYIAHQSAAYTILADIKFARMDPSLFSTKKSGSFPVKGMFDGSFKLTGTGQSLDAAIDNSQANLIVTGRDGVLTAFQLDNRSQLGLLGVGILGQSLNRPGITAMAETIPYFKDVRFQDFVLELNRGADKRVLIPQLKLIGESLLIDGSGFIAASSLRDVMDQPLQLGLELGAKGKLTDYLQTLQLLQPTTSADGFRRWNKRVNLTGTLSNPNTDELMAILNNAARSALTKPQAVPSPQPEATQAEGTVPATEQEITPTQPKTKEEKRREDIEMGLDLLNSIFGN